MTRAHGVSTTYCRHSITDTAPSGLPYHHSPCHVCCGLRFERDIDSRLNTSPSGTVEGTATFTPIQPRHTTPAPASPTPAAPASAAPDSTAPAPAAPDTTPAPAPAAPSQLLYREEGQFRVRGGAVMRATREYVYEYDKASDELSVHFAKAGAKDYLFHRVRVLPPANAAAAGPGPGRSESTGPNTAGGGTSDSASPGAAGSGGSGGSGVGGWLAVGEQHLCGLDLYDTRYRFVFQGVHVVEMEVRYDVRGPCKDYTSVGRYTRVWPEAGKQ